MPRFERQDDRRYWEISIDGKTVQTRAGFLGSEGRASNKKAFKTLKAAQAEVSERIEEQTGKGYLVLPTWKEPVDEGLAEAIAADPTVPGPYLVYADWLQGKRNPRGELITLQSALAERPDDKKLRAAEKALLEKHPKLVPQRLADVSLPWKKKHPPYAVSGLTWQLGFIASARIARFFPDPPYTIRELLVELLEHPAGRFLQTLELGVSLNEDGVASYVGPLDELARLRPKTLRRLSVVEAPPDAAEFAFSELGSVAEVMKALPALQTLHLAARSMSFSPVTMPNLRELSVTTPDATAIAALGVLTLPALETLRIDPGDVVIDEKFLALLRTGAAFPKLTRLTLTRTRATDGLVLALRDSELLARLQTLSFAGGRLSLDGAKAIVDAKPAFSHLKLLDLSNNELSGPPAALSSVCAEVRLDAQRGKAAVALDTIDIAALAPDAATLAKAKAIATPKQWPQLGLDGDVFWGQCQGSALYDVTLRAAPVTATCTCPANSFRSACKHAVALAQLVSQGHPFPKKARPFDE